MKTHDRPGPDWFTGSYAQTAFETHLIPWAGHRMRAAQIGAYCGDASVWMLDNVLTHPESRLVDIDTWAGSDEVGHADIDFSDVYSFYSERVGTDPRVEIFAGTSDEFFDTRPEPFDFIYIDGAHTPEQVLRDAVNADRYLTVGGMMAFDDYLWYEQGNPHNTPGVAIDAFLRCFEHRYMILAKDLQVWVRRLT